MALGYTPVTAGAGKAAGLRLMPRLRIAAALLFLRFLGEPFALALALLHREN